MTVNLDNIQLRHSALTDRIYLCRFGKDPGLALDKREAEADAVSVVVDHMMHARRAAQKRACVFGANGTNW